MKKLLSKIAVFIICISLVAMSVTALNRVLASSYDLAGIINEATVDAAIVVTESTEINTGVTVTDGKDINIDLNGKTVTLTGDSSFFLIDGGATLTIRNGRIVSEQTTSSIMFVLNNGSTINLVDVDIYTNNSVFGADDTENGAYLVNTALSFTSWHEGGYGHIDFFGPNNMPIDVNNITSPYVSGGDSNTDTDIGSGDAGGSLSSTVTATVTGSHSISVPTEITFGILSYSASENESERYKTVELKITVDYLVTQASKLVVNVTGSGSDGGFAISTADGKNSIAYTVWDEAGNEVSVGGVLAEFTEAGTKTVTLRLDKSQLKRVGDYSGKLSFDVSFE